MKLRSLVVAVAAFAMAGSALAQDVSSEKGKLSYYFGYDYGNNLAELTARGEQLDINSVVKGLQDVHARLKAGDSVRVTGADAMTWMARQPAASFELVFLDPPFDADLFAKAVAVASRVVVPGGLIYLEADREFSAEDFSGEPLTRHRHGRAGTVHYHLFQRAEPGYTAPESTEAAPKEPA